MKNIQSKFSKSNNHKARKLLLNEYIEQVGILQQENKALREMVLDIKNASGKALKQLIREELCEVLNIKNASGKALKQLIRAEVCEVLKEILE